MINKHLLTKEVQDYINANRSMDLHSLLLKKSPFSELKMQEIVQQMKGKQVAEKKFPFLLKQGIVFPRKLSLEQSSSTPTAEYKQSLASGETMVDLTSGFGIDAYFLGQDFKEVSLVERQKELLEIVQHNWSVLGREAQFINEDLQSFLERNQQEFDVVYLDPARRNEQQRKVFLLEDLSPNVLAIQNQLLRIGKQVLVKLSPLIDISYLIDSLLFVKEIHIVAVKNEVKELLVLMERDFIGQVKVKSVNLQTNEPDFVFNNNEHYAEITYSDVLDYLYIPNNAVLKSGNFKGIAEKYNLSKLHPNTHFYTSENQLNQFSGRILKVEKITAKQIEKGAYYNIISKNHPLKPAQIKKKYNLKDGGNRYLIFTQSKKGKIILKSLL
ncbi:MAG: methyltransferase [Flavobacteriales bacterium]|nr:MAG: methyltransferase [Flavobacteriales bacterium]